jgi:hypothetical protein
MYPRLSTTPASVSPRSYWTASHREQEMRPTYLPIATGAVNVGAHLPAAPRKGNRSCVQRNFSAFVLKDLPDGDRDILILVLGQVRHREAEAGIIRASA